MCIRAIEKEVTHLHGPRAYVAAGVLPLFGCYRARGAGGGGAAELKLPSRRQPPTSWNRQSKTLFAFEFITV